MKYRLMGSSGLWVSEVALGAMTFGNTEWGVEKDESRSVYEGFREAGGNFVDTANIYSGGRSEQFAGEFIADHRDEVVLATKYSAPMRPDDLNALGNSRKHMMESVHASLKRLDTDYIDLYWVHARDHTTMAEEIMRGLDDLVTSGKVLYVGISDAPAWQVARCNTIAELRGWSRFVGLQIRYSLIDREVEHELLPMAEALDLTVTPWDTLGSGVLTGKYNRDADTAGRATLRGRISERGLRIAAEVVAVADELGCSPAQVALSWVRSRKGVIVPLIGARTRAQLDDNLGCLDLELPDEALTRLNEVSSIRTPFPHNMLAPFRSIGSGESHRPDQH